MSARIANRASRPGRAGRLALAAWLCWVAAASGRDAVAQPAPAVPGGGAGAPDQGGSGQVAGPPAATPLAGSVSPGGLLPATGTDMRVGDLRAAFGGSYDRAPPAAMTRGWTWTPSLDVTETFDDGAPLANGRTGSAFTTQVTPGVMVTLATQRLTGALSYAPTLVLYDGQGSTVLAQNLNAYATLELVSGFAFVDVRGYAARQALIGGQTLGSSGYLTGQDQVQSSSFSVSPYIRQRFGGTGTLLAGVALGHTSQSTDQTTLVTSPYYAPVSSNVTTTQAHVSFTTGEDFGRLSLAPSAVATRYDGNGVLHGASRDILDVPGQYALSRGLALTASVGHEDIHYGSTDPFGVHDITWSGGVRLTPNADTLVALSYGHHDGGNSVTLDSSFAPTARTRLFARYSEGISTSSEDLQNAVAASTVGPGGISVDRVTGAPLLIGNPFFGTQAGLYRSARASVTGSLLFDRDIVTVTGERDQQTALSATAIGFAPGTTGVFASLGWAHSISPEFTTSAFGQIGALTASGIPGVAPATQDSATFSASVTYDFSPTLRGTAQYSRSIPFGGSLDQAGARDVAIIGLHKGF
jgi:uncharacterized protein (PEP-CTERM system associated)